MKTLLLNDTRHWHYGCVEVIRQILRRYKIDQTDLKLGQELHDVDLHAFDRIILNGEGTMHHHAPKAIEYLALLSRAQKIGCETHIINSVWQDMPHHFDDVLKKCGDLSVREVKSQNEMRSHGVLPSIYPDLSYFGRVERHTFPHERIYEGEYQRAMPGLPNSPYPRVSIFKDTWRVLVNKLRNCDLLLTGRHHELYAACKARCRVLIKPGNSWKNEGLFESAGVEIPYNIDRALAGDFDQQYERLWAYLDSFQ